jgi:hypothetical protein
MRSTAAECWVRASIDGQGHDDQGDDDDGDRHRSAAPAGGFGAEPLALELRPRISWLFPLTAGQP